MAKQAQSNTATQSKPLWKRAIPLLGVLVIFAATAMGFGLHLQNIQNLAHAESPDDIVVTRVGLNETEPAAGVEAEIEAETAPMLESVTPRAMGDPNAPIAVREYASLTCPHCGDFHNDILPDIKANFIDTGKVYFIFNDFPLNSQALEASTVAHCLPEERYFGFISLLFKTMDQWATGDYRKALRQHAKLGGLSTEQYDACIANTALQESIIENMQTAKTLWQIGSTPSFVINNGEKIIVGAEHYSDFETEFNKFLK